MVPLEGHPPRTPLEPLVARFARPLVVGLALGRSGGGVGFGLGAPSVTTVGCDRCAVRTTPLRGRARPPSQEGSAGGRGGGMRRPGCARRTCTEEPRLQDRGSSPQATAPCTSSPRSAQALGVLILVAPYLVPPGIRPAACPPPSFSAPIGMVRRGVLRRLGPADRWDGAA